MIGFGQDLPINKETGEVTYAGVVELEGISKSALYLNAYEWFAKSFNSPKDVIKMQDKDGGVIISKGVIRVYRKGRLHSGEFNYTMSFYAKPGRYKYEITNIFHHSDPSVEGVKLAGGNIKNEKPDCRKIFMPPKQWKDFKNQVHSSILNMITSFNDYMKSSSTKNDDW